MAITVKRGGETATNWYDEGYSVRTSSIKASSYSKSQLRIDFKISSKGGGVTDIQIMIYEDDFPELARLMVQANPVATIKAFGSAMADLA